MRPEHLRERAPELRQKAWAVVALALGAVSFIVVAVSQPHLTATPDPRIAVPGLGVTLAAGVASWLRRERAYPIWLAGVGLAAAALLLGWFLILAIVVAVAVVLIAILHAVL